MGGFGAPSLRWRRVARGEVVLAASVQGWLAQPLSLEYFFDRARKVDL